MIRSLKLLSLATLLLMSVLVTQPVPAAAQTKKEARACINKYADHGSGTNTDNKLTKKLSTEYNNSKCPESKGGNCNINSGSSGAVIRCKDPDYVPGVNQSGGGINDPALEAVCNEDGCELIQKYVNPFINLMTVLVGIAVVIGIIVGGIQVATSAGDPQKAASGKDHIRNAMIAIVAYLLLFSGLQFILPGGFL